MVSSSFYPFEFDKLRISEGLEISHPALGPCLSKIHHYITIFSKNYYSQLGRIVGPT